MLEGVADMIMTLVYVLVKVGHQVDSGSHLYIDVAPVLFQQIWIVWHHPCIPRWIRYTAMPAVKYVTPVVNLCVLSLWFWILIAAPSPRLTTPAIVPMCHKVRNQMCKELSIISIRVWHLSMHHLVNHS